MNITVDIRKKIEVVFMNISFRLNLILLVMFMIMINRGECSSERDRAYGHASSRAAKILQKQFGIHCCGSGCKTNQYIEQICLSFQVYRELDLEEARKLILELANRYLEILNSDQVLRPLMVKYPFDEENIDIILFFQTKQRDRVWHPKISRASMDEGKLFFCSHEKNNIYAYKDKIYENYSEALEKAGFTKPSNQKSSQAD